MDNTSGQGKAAVVPPEIKGWNWGAFLLNWVWGIGNETYISFLVVIPYFGLIFLFVLGAKGSEWAWRNKKWESVEQFRRVQRKWSLWGLALVAIGLMGALGALVGFHNDPVPKMALERLELNRQVQEELGSPMKAGFASGQTSLKGNEGQANLLIPVVDSRGKGTAYVVATRQNGVWRIDKLVFYLDGSNQEIEVVPQAEVR
ncbi:MAG: cytochrome c oxidase assembly factor Coa1 family protein [Thiobacillaceae bacterium]